MHSQTHLIVEMARLVTNTAQDGQQALDKCVDLAFNHSLQPRDMLVLVTEVDRLTGWNLHQAWKPPAVFDRSDAQARLTAPR
ncbi:MAG: hypothetical protein H3C38_04060 [Rhodospirillales bacterium]|nr:hypothetical protein [Rhodospirillales bacterium]